jgi:hypothetical protein
MKWRWLVVLAAALGVLAAGPALAKHKRHYHHHRTHWVSRACADRPLEFSWTGWLFNPGPQPNGCAPPVYEYGEYVGQDPDPFIRQQLRRDPATGYSSNLAR